jgi:sugar/nucleoside kinase (ribokinase family)
MAAFSVTGEVSLDRLEQPGEPVWEGLGGCATYLTLVTARQGHRVQFATVSGSDVPDSYLVPLLEAGVDLRLQILNGCTARLALQYDDLGEIVALRFEGGVERDLDVDLLPGEFWGAEWILVGTAPHGFQKQVVTRGRQEGCKTALSTQGEFDGEWDLLFGMLPHLDVLFVNSREVVNLRGGSLIDELGAMKEVNPRLTCLVTCGGRGAFVIQGEDLWWVEACRSPLINATGAGDTFAATWLGGYAEGMGNEVSLVRAAVGASLALRRMAHTGIPGEAELRGEMDQCELPQVLHWNLADSAGRQALETEDKVCHWKMEKSVK